MFSYLTKSVAAFLATAVLLALCLLAGCQASNHIGEAGSIPGAAAQDANRDPVSVHMSLVQDYRLPPQNVQELVNRGHAIVIGTISAISDLKKEIPYNFTAEEYAKEFAHLPDEVRPNLMVNYYDIAIEEILLDDGNVRAHPRLRLEAISPVPQLGERYLFTMGRNPDSLSYGTAAPWMTLTMDDGDIRYLDGSVPEFAGISNETSLVAAVREAVPKHNFLPSNQWPSRFDSNEGIAWQRQRRRAALAMAMPGLPGTLTTELARPGAGEYRQFNAPPGTLPPADFRRKDGGC